MTGRTHCQRTSSKGKVAQSRGMILVVILIVIAMLSLAGYAFSELMFTEYKAARIQGHDLQARALAESGVDYARAYLAQPAERRGERDALGDGRDRWRGVVVFDDMQAGERGRFAIVAPPLPDEQSAALRFGLADESVRLNLHALLEWDRQRPGAAREALLHLPGMTNEIADALLDWIDDDEMPRESGAEAQHYARLDPPYSPPNRVPTELEELLLVRGITRAALFGSDTNRNGHTEPREASRFQANSGGMRVESGEFGWAAYLTVASAEGNRNPQGQPRIDLNDPNLAALHRRLSVAFDDRMATFVLAYRQFGPYLGAGAESTSPGRLIDFTIPGSVGIVSPLDLVGARVMVPGVGASPTIIMGSPFPDDRAVLAEGLSKLMDFVTTSPTPRQLGRINVNAAPRAVLAAVPELPPNLVEEIIAKRGSAEQGVDPAHRHATWLYLDGLVDLPTMRKLLAYLTGAGDVHRAQIVGYFDQPAPPFRVDVVIDATSFPPQLVSWHELGQLGRGYDRQLLGLEPPTNLP